MDAIQYVWKDRKRILGMPITFTRYRLSEDRLFCEKGFLNFRRTRFCSIGYRIWN